MAAHAQPSMTAQDLAKLDQADRSLVAAALARLQIAADGDWLGLTHPYAAAAQDRIRADNKTIPLAQEQEFGEYLAASAFVHCGDAWGYLGRAIDAVLRGDVHTAVHLGYYAELRGAIALLASEGIYVGNAYSAVLASSGRFETVSKHPTHQATWQIIDGWRRLKRSSNLIGDIVRPGGVPVLNWVPALGSITLQAVISDLLDGISFDLQAFAEDRDRRNTASYEPTRLQVKDLAASDIQRIVTSLWLGLEPEENGGFPVLDQTLGEEILKGVFSPTREVLDSNGISTGQTDWSDWESWLALSVPGSLNGTSYHESLKSSAGRPATGLIGAALSFDAQQTDPCAFVESLLARTIILLRLTTGSCINLADLAGVDLADLEPWVEALGQAHSIWSPGQKPDASIDLWADVDFARELLEDADATNPRALLEALGVDALTLGQAERVVAWSFAS